MEFRFDVARHYARNLDLRVSGLYLPDLYVGLTQYGARATIEATPQRDDYWILIPTRGRLATCAHKEEFMCDSRRGFIFSYPSMGPSRIHVDLGGARMTVVICRAAIDRQLATLLGRPSDTLFCPPVEFAPAINLSVGHGRNIARYAHMVLADIERGGESAYNAVARSSFEQFVTTELLLSHPHNYHDIMHGPAPLPTPRDVRRAIDYMRANLTEPLRLADVVGAAGVPARTLFKHFEECRGISPIRYLRDARLDRVRDALLRAEPEECVTKIAMDLGFSHMGRFAVEYRKRFGESPSRTLRKSRNR
jgi:AraC-like DNA-binding protein